ncbi:sulfotransferase [Palleronia sp.]|uniref:sulfotransferase family protein n=1 Tax=Palleronia sp. TaxID=1940284 RepID=UPI0035C7E126
MTVSRRKPDFLVIGATKSGTTSLDRWLRGHPQIWMPEKELRYFTVQHNLHRGPDWYAAQFAGAPRGAILGESSNAYTRHPVYDGVPERIAAALPDIKLIYLIRDPMRRIESHYRHRLVTGIEWRGPDAAVRSDPRYLAASLYGHQLAQYRRFVSAERILVLQAEEMFADPGPVLARVAAFLGVAAENGPRFAAANVTASRRVAPWPLRRLAAYPPAKDTAKKIARTIGASPLKHLLSTADQPGFVLSPELRAELHERFETDRQLLDELTSPQTADQSLVEALTS